MRVGGDVPTTLHFINAGQGNMVLCQLDGGTRLLYDCNVTAENANNVLGYLGKVIGWGNPVHIFVNSHRDADHMRGVKRVHAQFPIKKVWDSGVTGNTPNSTEYREYMELRRVVGFVEVEKLNRWTFGRSLLRIMNSRNGDLPDEPNAQSIVIKVQHLDTQSGFLASAMLTGDTDAQTWRQSILRNYSLSDLKTEILLASHHGSVSFFDDPSDEQNYYIDHMKAISPAMTVISVGDNVHGHPDDKAVSLYEKYSRGSANGEKLRRTDQHGNIRLELKDEGGWSLSHGQ
jgi:beta-lactamase superfamily II metal-dependent hydrolase